MSTQEQGKASEEGGRGGGAEGEQQPQVGTDGVPGSQRAITQSQTQPTLATAAGETKPSTGPASPPYKPLVFVKRRNRSPSEDSEPSAVVRWGLRQAESTVREADARVGKFEQEYNSESDEDVEGSDDNEDDSNDDAGCTPVTFANLPDFPDDDDEDDPDYIPADNDSDLELDLDHGDKDDDDSDDDESVIRDMFRFHHWLTSHDDGDNDGDAAQRRQLWRSIFPTASHDNDG